MLIWWKSIVSLNIFVIFVFLQMVFHWTIFLSRCLQKKDNKKRHFRKITFVCFVLFFCFFFNIKINVFVYISLYWSARFFFFFTSFFFFFFGRESFFFLLNSDRKKIILKNNLNSIRKIFNLGGTVFNNKIQKSVDIVSLMISILFNISFSQWIDEVLQAN